MPDVPWGVVIFGDVVGSRRRAAAATSFLREVAREIDAAYGAHSLLAPSSFTQGDELQVLLAPGANPFLAPMRASLRGDSQPMRWAIAAGPIDPGSGPATQRTGEAYLVARRLLERAKAERLLAAVATGDAAVDALLTDVASLLPRLLLELTPRQRELARLILVDGLRRAEVADRLGISRATVSVMADRARVRDVERLAGALARMFRTGVAAALTAPASGTEHA